MTVSIVTCPGCHALVLSDTAQCPTCRHVFDAERAAHAAEPMRPTGSEHEEPCPNCGDMVRKGLVRCFNCGHFMRKEIARLYKQMQATESPVIYSPMDEPEPGSAAAAETEVATSDDDFELAPEFSLVPAAAAAPPAAADEPAETYSLAEPAPSPAEPQPAAAESPAPSESPAEPDAAPKPRRPEAAEAAGGEAHSVATAGDALLNIAMQEEQEETERRKNPRRRRRAAGPITGDSVLVHCTCGARIRVSERHRGLLGHCPKCKTPFIVPPKSAYEAQAKAIAESGQTDATPADAVQETGPFRTWLEDVAVHTVNPTKLRIKPGSLKGDFQAMDLGFSPEGLLLVTLTKKSAGLFGVGGSDKTKEPTRQTVREHLRVGGKPEDTPAPAKRYFEAETLKTVAVVQPMPYIHESMFGGVPVFGEGRIAVRLPKTDQTTPELLFASFELSGFRAFAAAMQEFYGMSNLGAEQGVPLDDELTEAACHYSDEKLRILDKVEFYQADPKYKVKLIGRRCQGCGLVVSEDSRKKEKIGGANGKAIAKAKCPKCGQPFGDISLYTLDQPAEQPKEEAATA